MAGILRKTTRIVGHFRDGVKIQCNRNSLKSIKVSLSKTPGNEDMESEPGIFYNQSRPQVEGLGHQPRHKTLDLSYILPVECFGTRVSRIFIKQTIETSSSNWEEQMKSFHSQILRWAWGGGERLEEPEGSGTPWEQGSQNQLTETHRGLQRSASLQGFSLGPLQIIYCWEACHSCGTPNSGSWGCLSLLCHLVGLFLSLGYLISTWCEGVCLTLL